MAKIGKYELVKKIATGEAAEVFLAKLQWARGLEKTVVVKRLLPHLAKDPEFVEQFSFSAQVATQLNHPNIAQILELGESEGSYYLVMEYVDGPSLRALAAAARAGGGIPFAYSVKIIAFCCEGLAYAHELTGPDGQPLHLVQRDVTPDNILISKAGAVKLVDFGIAKVATQPQQTKSLVVKGKLAYMSPEQLRAEPLDRRSDVYSLGMVLYELLAGAKPYDAKSDIMLMHAMLYEERIPLRTRRPDVPEALERIVDKALERDRDRRYPDCLAMHADLEEHLVSSRQPVSVLQLAQLAEKHQLAPAKPTRREPLPAAPPPPPSPPAPLPDPPSRPQPTTITRISAQLRELLKPAPTWDDDASTEKTQPQMVVEIPPPPEPEQPPAPPEAVHPARRPTDRVPWDILEEHLGEASFLHGQWEEALRSPDFTLASVAASPERRLLAHLGGLVLGGPRVAEQLLAPSLAGDEPGTVFAAAFALLDGGRPADFEALIGALEKGDPVQRAAICRAMAVAPGAEIGPQLTARLEKLPALQMDLLEVLGQLRVDPGLPLEPLVNSRKPSLAALALRLGQVFSSRLDPAAVERAYASPVPEVCAAGFETGLVLRSRDAFAACESAVEARSPGFSTAALLLGLSGDDQSVTTLLKALGDEDSRRDAAFALGFSGRVTAAAALLDAMDDGDLAPLAGEAFAAITGFGAEEEPAGRRGGWGPAVKADDGVERSRSEAALAPPDPEEAARWWEKAKPKLDPARRWLRGQRWSAEALLGELEHGPARRREALALDVAIRARGQVQISWNGLSNRQRRELGEARNVRRQIHEGSYRDFNRRRP